MTRTEAHERDELKQRLGEAKAQLGILVDAATALLEDVKAKHPEILEVGFECALMEHLQEVLWSKALVAVLKGGMMRGGLEFERYVDRCLLEKAEARAETAEKQLAELDERTRDAVRVCVGLRKGAESRAVEAEQQLAEQEIAADVFSKGLDEKALTVARLEGELAEQTAKVRRAQLRATAYFNDMQTSDEHLAEARAALKGIGGIYDEFESLPDAIGQMALHIKEQGQRIAGLEKLVPDVDLLTRLADDAGKRSNFFDNAGNGRIAATCRLDDAAARRLAAAIRKYREATDAKH